MSERSEGTRPAPVPGGIGTTLTRPDALAKAVGAFPYTADLDVPGMTHAALVRSPHAHAVLLELDVAAARTVPGVLDVVTAVDLPGAPGYGPERADRPVLATGVVRHRGEAVAAVLATDRVSARRGAAALAAAVRYRPLPPVPDAEQALRSDPVHPDGTVIREMTVHHGSLPAGEPAWDAAADPLPGATVVVAADYEIAPRPGGTGATALALPVGGGIDVVTATAWARADRDQIAQCLNLTPGQLRLRPAGAAGPPTGELAAAVLAGLLAGRSGRPVLLDAEPGQAGAAGQGPAVRLRYRHHADAEGRLVAVQARIRYDAGAYAGAAGSTIAQLCAAGVGPYAVPAVHLDAVAVRTTNPPVPEPRGGGASLACVAVEAQMDALARYLGLDPLALRELNRLDVDDPLPTGQLVPGGVPSDELLTALRRAPLPGRRRSRAAVELPGGPAGAADRRVLRRGVGHALGITPLLPGEGADHPATATVRYAEDAVSVRCAAAELGQGFPTVAMQIVREVLGAGQVEVLPFDADGDDAGPAGASRLTWVAGGAVHAAARAVADILCAELATQQGVSVGLLRARGGRIRSHDGLLDVSLREVAAGRVLEQTATFHPPPTEPLDPAGQGRAFAGFGCAAHRAVVDVDPDLGLVRLVELVVAADVGRVVNLTQLLGCLDGGSTAGVGLALLEDAREPGPVLLPTTLDAPGTSVADLLETGQPGSWSGLTPAPKGAWDITVGSAAAAVLAAVRDATGRPVRTAPVRPWHLCTPDTDGAS